MPPPAERLALTPALLLVGLLCARMWRTGDDLYAFLLWNVALACIPAALALLADRFYARRAHGAALATLALWLLFLPNAPYVLTDFVHLRARAPVPLWFDVALLGAAALAGLALGAVSLARVDAIARHALGGRAALVVVLGASLASGYGIYLGRFARLDSWDVALHPLSVLARAAPPLLHPALHARAWAVTLVFGALTAASYLGARGLRGVGPLGPVGARGAMRARAARRMKNAEADAS